MFRQRLRRLRVEIDREAIALILSSGANVYSIACRRAKEASSHKIANDWSEVAAAIGRSSRKRPSRLAYVSH
jgi:hypothetical protein